APAVVSRGLSLAAFIAFLSYMDKMFKPLVLLSKVNLTFQKVSAAGDRRFELIDSEVEVLETPDALGPTTTEGRIVFEHVTCGHLDSRMRTTSSRVCPKVTRPKSASAA